MRSGMIKTQSQNKEIRQIDDKVWDKVGNEVKDEVYYKVWTEVLTEVFCKVWGGFEVRNKVWRKLFE